MVIGAGDFASVHEGLEETIEALRAIEAPDPARARQQRDRAGAARGRGRWPAATVLHGEGAELDGVEFFGLGAGVPVTPWDWSFDLTEEEAGRRARPLPGRSAC